METKFILVILYLFIHQYNCRAVKEISNSIPVVKNGYTCGSICGGHFHICAQTAGDVLVKFKCIKKLVKCRFNCQNDIGEFPNYHAFDKKSQENVTNT